jgi:hypothetical protein
MDDGIQKVVDWFVKNHETARKWAIISEVASDIIWNLMKIWKGNSLFLESNLHKDIFYKFKHVAGCKYQCQIK